MDWLDGLAIDGKTVRNSAAPGGGADVRLFSALLHHEQVVINQIGRQVGPQRLRHQQPRVALGRAADCPGAL